MKSILVLFLLCAIFGPALPRIMAQDEASQLATRQRLAAAQSAIDGNSQKIKVVTASGRIRHLTFQRNVEQPNLTLEADLRLIYEAPKFSLHLQYVPAEMRHTSGPLRAAPVDAAETNELDQQTILFDGKTVTTIERNRQGKWRGDIYFEFHKQNMLRMAGFPFEDPVTIWNEPLRIDRADLVAAHTTPLAGGGFVGQLTKDTYRLKFYFLGSFAYDLRRVSSYRLDEDIPFRDWHLSWQHSQGVFYVERLQRRINEATSPMAQALSSGVSHELVDLEYSSFRINPSIDPSSFELSSVPLPEETPFYDHRININGKPEVRRWRAGSLTDSSLTRQ
jgi:hypothetical protein